MKTGNLWKQLILSTLLMGWVAVGPLVNSALAQAPAQPAQQASPWKDRAEYDAFNAILQAKDPAQQVELADKYLAAYPESKVKDKVFEIKLQSYQQQNNAPKMEETANQLLAISPDNFRALLLLSYLIPRTLTDSGMDQKLTAAGDYAKRGLDQLEKLPAPPGMSPEDFQKQKDQSGAIFHQTAGFVALQKKDYPAAAEDLKKSAEMNPNDGLGFYWLGLAYLSQPKPDTKYDEGVWAMARAVSMTGAGALPDATKQQVREYVGKVYEARHGDTEGLDPILAQAATTPFPPADFHIKSVEEIAAEAPPEPEPPPPPVARELSVKPEELDSFDVIAKYLQAGGAKETDTWELMKGATLTLPGKVVSAMPAARPRTIRVAVDPALAQQDGKYDVEVTLAEPAAKALAKGQDIAFEAICESYTAKPFVLKMTEGKLK